MSTLSTADTVLETHVFWYRHRITITAVFILAVLAVAAWGAYRFNAQRLDKTAEKALAAAKTAADLQKVITQYPATPAGASAYLFLAEEQKKDKKFTEANATLQSFLDKYPNHQLKGTARMAMAGNLESLGKPDEALGIYDRLANDDPQGFVAPAALMAKVPILKAKNQADEARRVCETIMSKYHESLIANEAQRQLRILKPPAPAATPAPTPPVLSAAQILQNLVPSLKARPPKLTTPAPSAAASPGTSPAATSPAAATSPGAATTTETAQPPQSGKKRHRRNR